MTTPIIDSHAHYNLDPIYSEWDTFMNESVVASVIGAVIPGVDETSTVRGAELTAKTPYFRYAVGIHPVAAGEDDRPITPQRLATLFAKASAIAKPSAIGETGLDYFHLPENLNSQLQCKEKQHTALRAHLALAAEHRLPVIIHVRDKQEEAYTDLLSMLQKNVPDVPIILHCVSGPLSYVKACLELGAFISVAGNVTYPNAQSIRDILAITPADKLLVETDAPYLPPQPHRGQVCHPAYIRETANYLAKLGVDLDQTRANAVALFGIE